MLIQNKVTKLYPSLGSTMTEEAIQEHINTQNNDGWYLVHVDNLGGWYRFFWAKESA